MKKPLTIGFLAAAIIAGALSLVKVDGQSAAPAAVVTQAVAAESEAQPVVVRMAQLAVSQPHMFDYERGPRIIHVPQGDRTPDRGHVRPVSRPAARASLDRRPEPAAIEEDDDDEHVEATPPPPSASKKKIRVIPMKSQADAAPPPQPPAAITPRWKLRGDAPPPQGPRRALLSAPPPNSAGPTPLRPTPNFDTKAADRGEAMGEKFVAPGKPTAPATIVTESQPPLGYSPPAMPATPEPPADVLLTAPPPPPPPEDDNPTN
ncbi:MAG: hypothetical protein Q8M24_05885 [Pseudolabrys sp.]|nr:hypothetical protein [Pseudolabrys sp.]MDP2294977.1 hypothetical protein [Pseudolabrys sp.]